MMAENGATIRELLLQLNDKLGEFMAESKADRATLTVKIDSIQESVKVMNHNSTILAERVSGLEGKVSSAEEQKKVIKDLLSSERNWVIGSVTLAISVLTILSLLHII
jgi:predicted nuclease with TOPRIM domain